MFSHRSSPSLAPNRLAEAIARARAQGHRLLDLTCSNPTQAGLPYDRNGIDEALRDARAHRYEPEPFGLPSARSAVADDWQRRGFTVDPDRIVLTASTSEGYAHSFKLLCDPGDEVLVPEPSYPLFEHLARFDAVLAVPYRLEYDGTWYIDLDSVRRAVNSRTRAIVLVSPHNPTGSFTRRAELEALSEFGLPIISDEVFEAYPLSDGAARAASALEVETQLVITLGGLSKLAALPQHKLGWMTVGGPAEPARAALARLELLADTYLSVNTSVQHALPRLLEVSRPTRRALTERLFNNLGVLEELLRDNPVSLLRPEGGWYAVLRLPRLATEEQWVVELVELDRVLVQPGWFYDFVDEPILVVSLLTPEPEFRAGAQRVLGRVVDRASG